MGDDEAKLRLLELIRENKVRYGILIVSYSLMSTHPHVVCTATLGQKAFSAFWRAVNHAFARWYNGRRRRRGQVIMDRMRSPPIQDDRHLLTVVRYGDLNPVRASLVRAPKDWRWSSHRHYAYGEPDDVVDDCAFYLGLGRTGPERRRGYRQLFRFVPAKPYLVRRPELVHGPFIGDVAWIALRLASLRRKPDT